MVDVYLTGAMLEATVAAARRRLATRADDACEAVSRLHTDIMMASLNLRPSGVTECAITASDRAEAANAVSRLHGAAWFLFDANLWRQDAMLGVATVARARAGFLETTDPIDPTDLVEWADEWTALAKMVQP